MMESKTHSNLSTMIVVLGLIVWSAFQTVQLVGERQAISTAKQNQEQLMANSKKMRDQLDAIAAKTKRLAEQGNPNAQLVVQQLAKNGININPDAKVVAAPK
jgi:hypothetical protein